LLPQFKELIVLDELTCYTAQNMPIGKNAALMKINNDKSIGWIGKMFGQTLFETAVAGRSGCAIIEHSNTISFILSINYIQTVQYLTT
jgi:hypothetical protein